MKEGCKQVYSILSDAVLEHAKKLYSVMHEESWCGLLGIWCCVSSEWLLGDWILWAAIV